MSLILRHSKRFLSAGRVFGRRSFASKVAPHGGQLMNNVVSDTKEQKELVASCDGRVLNINERESCDTELLLNGAFSPLSGFMNEDVYNGVVENMRIPESNLLFGLPVTLSTDREDLVPGKNVVLNYNGLDMAVLEIESRWKPDKVKEAKHCYLTTELGHPGVQMLAMEKAPTYIGGRIRGFAVPERVFPCISPADLRATLPEDDDVVAFQCRNPVHRAHYELFTRAATADNVRPNATVLVHPTCGPTQGDDIPGDVRYRTYEVLKAELNNDKIQWAYLPYSMHMAGPREAIQHMMIRKNYGCTHFIIGRDMAGSKCSYSGEDFYGAYDAQDLAIKYSEELGVKTVPSMNLVYTEQDGYVAAGTETGTPLKLSGTKFRKMLRAGDDIPEWFAFKSVVSVLREAQK